jgi:diguanylate cyclase (GGDEF)-like protein
MLETLLDATMFTIGAAGLSWPLLLGPLLDVSGPGAAYWVTLAYPVGDLIIIFAFASFFLGSLGSRQGRPRPYFLVICLAFLCQIVSDSAYFMITAAKGDYAPGSWLDPLWLMAFALAGFAALMEIRAGKEAHPAEARGTVPLRTPLRSRDLTTSHWRILIPYIALPILAGMIVMQLRADGWKWGLDTQVLAYLGFSLVALLLLRQYLVLVQNLRLNVRLSHMSSELEEKLGDLADVNERLEVLNTQSHHLNSLRELAEVAGDGLELACSFAKSPGGWISLKDEVGRESVTVSQGPVALHRPGDSKFNAVEVAKGIVRAVPLEVRGESLGTIWLARPEGNGRGPNLLPIIAAHIATAIDNTRRYEEAVHLAERDPLTGLFNHRGIHKRLAGESLRAQQNDSQLSLVMMDLDDFKLLNDTYGHPAGDSVLRQVSDGIRTVLRHADLAGRVGGDEILLVLPNTGAEGALQLSERLRDTLMARPYVTAGGHSIPVHLSLGVATFPGDAQSLGQLIETADANLYASKQRGGNTITGTPLGDGPAVDTQGLLGVAGRLLDVVGARDHYTRQHSEHVIVYALSPGEALGLSEDSLNTLHVAAMLHDVGKIGVSADLLSRRSALSVGEQDLVRRHVDMSAAVISDMPRLARVAEAVHAHQKHHDGGDYPAEAAGGQLDPELVQEFLRVIDRQGEQAADVQAEAG